MFSSILNTIMKNTSDYMFAKNLDSVYIAASDSYAKLFGYDFGNDIVGLTDLDLLKDETSSNAFLASDRKIFQTGLPLVNYIEEVTLKKEPGRKVLSISKYPLYDENNNISGLYCIIKDITLTTRYKKENLDLRNALSGSVHANNDKNNFLIRMSYDIRTPLTGIMGLASLCETYLDDKERLRESLRQINESGKYLVSVVSEILDMTKIESGSIELNVCDFDFLDFLGNAKAQLSVLAEEKNQHFSFTTEHIEHTNVSGDPIRVEQIITNLGGNAIKYTPENGHVNITIAETAFTDSTVSYRMIFTDDGAGMSEDILAHVFDPLSENLIGTPDQDLSTGLVLAVTKSIANLLDGDISVVSTPGKGTTFTVNITLSLQDDSSIFREETTLLDLENEDFTGKRALLVEDNELNAEIAHEILSLTNIEIERAEDGQQAVDMVINAAPGYYNVVFMDIQMPVMNGYEATKAIRESGRDDLKDLPIIAMTANAFISDINAAKNAGMNEHLSKPIDFDKLVIAMNKWIN